MSANKVDYLIIGNSAAGVSAAETLRALDADCSIAIVSREPYPAYGRPLISYLMEGKTDRSKIWLKDDGFYEEHQITTYFGSEYEVVKLHPADHVVTLANGETLEYGKCLLATGSVPFMPPIAGSDNRENIYSFITLDDAEAVWKEALAAATLAKEENRQSCAVVVGAGLIGLKAAEALSHHVDEVVVLELAPRILPAVLDAKGADILQKLLAQHGITCLPGISAEKFTGEGARVSGVVLTDGRPLSCDFVVAAVGVRPNAALAIDAGAEHDRGLICADDFMTSLEDVYAAGDVVQVTDLLDGSIHPLALWPNAMKQGRLAAHNMVGGDTAEPYTGDFAVNAVDFFDASLLTAGVINPKDDGMYQVDEVVQDDSYLKFVKRDGVLVGYILLNRPQNAGIYTSLIETGQPLDEVDSNIFEAAPTNLLFSDEKRWERLHKGYPGSLDRRGWKEAQ